MFVLLFIIGLNKNTEMVRSFFFLILLTLLSVSSFAQKNAILGTIVDQKQQPLAGVSVSLQGTVRGVQSDQSGNYILKDIPAGKYQLVVSHLGFQPFSRELILEAGAQQEIHVVLQESAV